MAQCRTLIRSFSRTRWHGIGPSSTCNILHEEIPKVQKILKILSLNKINILEWNQALWIYRYLSKSTSCYQNLKLATWEIDFVLLYWPFKQNITLLMTGNEIITVKYNLWIYVHLLLPHKRMVNNTKMDITSIYTIVPHRDGII